MSCRNEKKEGYRKPENLKGRPADCPPEQIRKCHGNAKKHPCTVAGAKTGSRG
jgi:hypothetical protein